MIKLFPKYMMILRDLEVFYQPIEKHDLHDTTITLDYLRKLREYKYVDEIKDLHYGAYIRWIPIKDPANTPLYKGGIVCDMDVTDSGINIKCKTTHNRFYRFKMDECLIFQKLSSQENVILAALNHLANK